MAITRRARQRVSIHTVSLRFRRNREAVKGILAVFVSYIQMDPGAQLSRVATTR